MTVMKSKYVERVTGHCFILLIVLYITLRSLLCIKLVHFFPLQLLELTENYTPEVSDYKVGFSTIGSNELYREGKKPQNSSIRSTQVHTCEINMIYFNMSISHFSRPPFYHRH